MKILRIVVSEFETNCYLVDIGNSIVLIDPGAEADMIRRHIAKPLSAVLLTHGHYDHIGAVNDFSEVPIYISAYDRPYLQDPELNLSAFLKEPFVANTRCTLLTEDTGRIEIDGTVFFYKVLPGHTPGSTVFWTDNKMFSGDVLFMNSVGRTDLPGGDWEAMQKSLQYFKNLKQDYELYPGHGPATHLSEELKYNPFLAD